MKWALQLGEEQGVIFSFFRVGVASDSFSGYTDYWPEQSWFFQHGNMVSNGHQQGATFDPPPFAAGDVVTVELERAPGVDSVLRVRLAGKVARELKGLPSDGVMYPIVGLIQKQSYTMVALP